jgi:hypothetical protein
LDLKNIKEMFKKNEESKSSIVKSDVIVNTKDYALENELNKILRNYPILNYINQNLENIDIKNTLEKYINQNSENMVKNTLERIKSENEDVVSNSQSIRNVRILKTLLFKK